MRYLSVLKEHPYLLIVGLLGNAVDKIATAICWGVCPGYESNGLLIAFIPFIGRIRTLLLFFALMTAMIVWMGVLSDYLRNKWNTRVALVLFYAAVVTPWLVVLNNFLVWFAGFS